MCIAMLADVHEHLYLWTDVKMKIYFCGNRIVLSMLSQWEQQPYFIFRIMHLKIELNNFFIISFFLLFHHQFLGVRNTVGIKYFAKLLTTIFLLSIYIYYLVWYSYFMKEIPFTCLSLSYLYLVNRLSEQITWFVLFIKCDAN